MLHAAARKVVVLPDLFFWSNDDAFRKKFPEMAQRHDLYRSMTSERARASVDWEAIKLTTLEKLQELLHLLPNCFRRREAQRTPRPLEIAPLAYCSSSTFELVPCSVTPV